MSIPLTKTLNETITISKQLFDDLVEDAIELRQERHWWKDEPRLNHQRDYEALCKRIDEGVKLRGDHVTAFQHQSGN